jgi:hypothetical protein
MKIYYWQIKILTVGMRYSIPLLFSHPHLLRMTRTLSWSIKVLHNPL